VEHEESKLAYREGLTLTPPVRFFLAGAAEAFAASPLSSGRDRSLTSDVMGEIRQHCEEEETLGQ
jgi:hypothetical protein